MADNFFPHEQIRPIQKEVIELISRSLKDKKGAILHAPTGLGKTAASLAPTLAYALEHNKTVYFLTSKNTQHKIAIETLRAMKNKHGIDLQSSDIVGKKWMCIQPGVQALSSGEFNEYCRAMREDKRCVFFEQVKEGEKLSTQTKVALSEMKQQSPLSVERIVEFGAQHELCPYELALLLAKEANIIIADYYYLFHPRIRETFLKKNNKTLEDAIIIIDEGHNFPDRIKNLATQTFSTATLQRASTEAKKHNYEALEALFNRITIALEARKPEVDEILFSKEEFVQLIASIVDYHDFMKECYDVGDQIREEQKTSAIGSIGSFLDAWLGGDTGFVRILQRKKHGHREILQLSYRCLDPGVVAKEIIEQSYSTILMSGTLTPTTMYAQLLGFKSTALQKEFPSPFPDRNRLNLIIAKTSTKYASRSTTQYRQIARILTDIINTTPGNSAIFFPSYYLKEQVEQFLFKVEKTVFQEHQGMSAQEREDLIEKFRSYKHTGAALLAVVAGSFGEGIDLPGDELKCVVVVGLPLARPDLETKALISYYDQKFRKGWDYGYVFPAFNKIIQNAGRCIRSAEDKGTIIFLDERFTMPNYYRCFPSDWKMKVSVDRYKEQLEKFWNAKDGAVQGKLPF